MKNREKILIGISTIVVASLVILLAGKNKKLKSLERLDRIAEEGYETAGDILYPIKGSFLRKLRWN